MAIGCLTACVTVHTQNINHWKYVKDFNIISGTAFSVFCFAVQLHAKDAVDGGNAVKPDPLLYCFMELLCMLLIEESLPAWLVNTGTKKTMEDWLMTKRPLAVITGGFKWRRGGGRLISVGRQEH